MEVSEGEDDHETGSKISLKVADNRCNLHLKPRLYTELNAWPGLATSKCLCGLLLCFKQKVALLYHLSFDHKEMNAFAPSWLVLLLDDIYNTFIQCGAEQILAPTLYPPTSASLHCLTVKLKLK